MHILVAGFLMILPIHLAWSGNLSEKEFKSLQGKTPSELVPSGWQLKEKRSFSKGDLNGDKIDDFVLIVEKKSIAKPQESDTDFLPIATLIFFGASDGTYKPVQLSEALVLTKSDGGQYDPFDKVEIKKGVISITQFGSNGPIGFERWLKVHKYRFQNGDFYLIGKTREDF